MESSNVKLTVLCDNHTYIDQYYLGEPAFSVLIEDGNRQILFDCAYSDTVSKNAEKLGIDLGKTTDLILSHGHIDHTRGLISLLEKENLNGSRFIASPMIFNKKRLKRNWGYQDFGIPYDEKALADTFCMNLTNDAFKVSAHVYFSGLIPRVTDFEPPYAIGEVEKNGVWIPDTMEEEGAVIIKMKDGLFIVTACTHCGIGNVIARAQDLFPGEKISGVLGGLHLFKPNKRLEGAIDTFKRNEINDLYPCHCTSFRCRTEIDKSIPVHEVGVGMVKTLECANE